MHASAGINSSFEKKKEQAAGKAGFSITGDIF